MTTQLDISPEILDTQKLLFDLTPVSQGFSDGLDTSAFIKDGYVVLDGMQNEFDAIERCYEVASSLRSAQLFYSEHLPLLQLSKADLIPTCLPFVEGGFQALHFDYGLPLLPVDEDAYKSLDIIAALYYPHSAQKGSGAATRIVQLSKIADQVKGRFKDVENKIMHYVGHYGDGWIKPAPYNTKRISIFARLLDACSDDSVFSTQIEAHSQSFFLPEGDVRHEEFPRLQLEMEQQYYKGFGIDLSAVEERIVLKPGQLLLIDNIRCVHGRIGYRNSKELWQFLYSLKEAPDQLIARVRKYVADLLSGYDVKA
jgi:hypothetical protein